MEALKCLTGKVDDAQVMYARVTRLLISTRFVRDLATPDYTVPYISAHHATGIVLTRASCDYLQFHPINGIIAIVTRDKSKPCILLHS